MQHTSVCDLMIPHKKLQVISMHLGYILCFIQNLSNYMLMCLVNDQLI
jgi:hypothetical protein